MSLSISSDYYLPLGIPYDPTMVMAAIENAVLAVTSTDISSGAVGSDQLASGSVTTDALASEAVTAAKIESGTITSNLLASNSVISSHISSNVISADKIMTDAVTATKIQAGAVTSDKIYASAVTSDKISVNSLDAISANLGEITSGIVTGATLQTSVNPAISRVKITTDGIVGYDADLGQTFKLPTDGSAPTFSSGVIKSATIIDTTIITSTFQTSTELPWIEITDAGVAYRFNEGGAVYDTDVYDTGIYGEGTTAYLFNSSKPILKIEEEISYADIGLYNRSSNPSGAAAIGDLACVSAVLKLCTTAGTPGTYSDIIHNGYAGTVTLNDASNAVCLEIDNDGTNNGLYLHQDGVLADNTAGAYIYSSAAQTNANVSLMQIYQQNASSTGTVLSLANVGTGVSLHIAQTGNGIAQEINNDGTNHGLYIHQDGNLATGKYMLYLDNNSTPVDGTGRAIRLDGCIISSTKNPETDAEAGFIAINVDGTQYAVPFYALS